MLVLMQEFSSR